MSPSINVTPDLLGMFKQQSSPVPTSAAADLETLCSALDALQAGGQADLNALAGCLSRLADWLKNQTEAAPGDVSGWTSEPFGVKGMGGMITCRSDQREVIFNQDGSGQPYMGMWHSRVPGEASRNGSFKIQAGAGGTQLVLEGSRPLQVSLPTVGAAAWGSMDAFHQGLNSSRQPNPTAPANQPADATLIESRPASVEIIVLSGELENQHFPVGDQLRLGREADNDLTLPDKKASRHHAILQRQGVVYQIIDLSSGNGTYVNGKRITDPTLLKNGDIVLIGDTKLTISYQP